MASIWMPGSNQKRQRQAEVGQCRPSKMRALLLGVVATICSALVALVATQDSNDFSNQITTCPNACSGNGECVKSVCLCLSTHTGVDCSKQVRSVVVLVVSQKQYVFH